MRTGRPDRLVLRDGALVAERAPSAPPSPGPTVRALAWVARVARRVVWRSRWQLGVAAVAVAGWRALETAPATLAAAGLVVAALAWAWAAHGRPLPGGRMVLSGRERGLLAAWGAGAGVGGVLAALVPGAPVWASAGLAVGPGVALAGTRLPAVRVSPSAGRWADALLARWAGEVAALDGVWGGSVPVPGTVVSPSERTLTVTVRLADRRHAEHATGREAGRAVERALGLGVGTVTVDTITDDCALVQVTITQDRHVASRDVPWTAPALDGGRLALGVDSGGRPVTVRLWVPTGIRHMMISGASDAGKSTTTRAVLAAWAAAGACVWVADGKRGTSVDATVRGLCDWVAVDPDGWEAMVDAAWTVMTARQTRRGALGLTEWTPTETDPVLVVAVDEGSAVGRATPARTAARWAELTEHGRTQGVAVVHISQSPLAAAVLGGAHARDTIAGQGVVVAHRAGSGSTRRIALGSADGGAGAPELDLTSLPAGPGWAVVLDQGQVVSAAARVAHATSGALRDWAARDRVTARALAGPDADAAGATYAARAVRTVTPGGAVTVGHPPATARVEVSTPGRVGGAAAGRVLDALRAHGGEGPVSRATLIETTGLADETVSRALRRLADDGLARRAGHGLWETTGDEEEVAA